MGAWEVCGGSEGAESIMLLGSKAVGGDGDGIDQGIEATQLEEKRQPTRRDGGLGKGRYL
jgi:hypothetical protein